MLPEDVLGFIVVVRRCLARAFGGVGIDVEAFSERAWRSFWYDARTGIVAISPYAAIEDPEDVLPTPEEFEDFFSRGLIAVFQAPRVADMPYACEKKGCAKFLGAVPIARFHSRYPLALPLVDVSVWTNRWCAEKCGTMFSATASKRARKLCQSR